MTTSENRQNTSPTARTSTGRVLVDDAPVNVYHIAISDAKLPDEVFRSGMVEVEQVATEGSFCISQSTSKQHCQDLSSHKQKPCRSRALFSNGKGAEQPASKFRNFIERSSNAAFPAGKLHRICSRPSHTYIDLLCCLLEEKDRYHLYISYACP